MRILPGPCFRILWLAACLCIPQSGYCQSLLDSVGDLFQSKEALEKRVAKRVLSQRTASSIEGLDFSPDGQYLAAISDGVRVQVFERETGQTVRELEVSPGARLGATTENIRYSPDGRFLAICHSSARGEITVRIWNTRNWEIAHDIKDFIGGGDCNAIDFTADSKRLIRALTRVEWKPGENLFIYDVETWEVLWSLRTVPFKPVTMALSPDGTKIALGGSNFPTNKKIQILVIDLNTRTITKTFDIETVFRLTWSADGKYIATSSAALHGAPAVRIYDAETGQLAETETFEGTPIPMRYTADGKYMIVSGFPGIRIWDGQHQKLLQEIPGVRKNSATCIAVSRDSRYMAAATLTELFVWQLK